MNAEAHIVPALGYLPLQPLTPALPQHRARQTEERLAVGPQWQDSGLVFTWPDGRPLHPERSPGGRAAHPGGRPPEDQAARRAPQLRGGPRAGASRWQGVDAGPAARERR
jgi:hypothetical protein